MVTPRGKQKWYSPGDATRKERKERDCQEGKRGRASTTDERRKEEDYQGGIV